MHREGTIVISINRRIIRAAEFAKVRMRIDFGECRIVENGRKSPDVALNRYVDRRHGQNWCSLLASTALSAVRHGIPEMTGNAWPSSGQNQQSLRMTRSQPLIGDMKRGSTTAPAAGLSTTTSAASFSGFELCGQRSIRLGAWPRRSNAAGSPRT